MQDRPPFTLESTRVRTHAPCCRSAASRRTARTARSRDPWFDNAKMLLVTLVVVGHSWTLLPQTVHDHLGLQLPLPVARAGVRAGHRLPVPRFTFSRRNLGRLVTTVVVPYLLFETPLTSVRAAVGGEHYERLFVNPHWPMWYLTALFLWRLATPLLARLPHAAAGGRRGQPGRRRVHR